MPPNGDAKKTGNWLAKPTEPSKSDDPVILYTSQDCATVCIQVPIREMSCPLKNSWKLRWRMARRAAGKRRTSEADLDSDEFGAEVSNEATFYNATASHSDATHAPLVATPLVTFWGLLERPVLRYS